MQLKRARDHVQRIVTSIGELEQLIQEARLEVAVTTRQTAEMSVQPRLRDSSLADMRNQLLRAGRIRIVGALAASIVHELQQPLAAVMANAAAAERYLQQSDPNIGEALAALEDIRRDEQRAVQLVERFRTLLKESLPSSEPCDLNDIIEIVAELVRGDATLRRIDFRCDLADELPRVSGDPSQLEQLLLNLILNAFDAVGGPSWTTRAVSVRTRCDDAGGAVVAVEDAGPPVPDRLFERMNTPLFTTKPDGLGLGLAICREILTAHGSELFFERRGGGGMVVSFCLTPATDLALLDR